MSSSLFGIYLIQKLQENLKRTNCQSWNRKLITQKLIRAFQSYLHHMLLSWGLCGIGQRYFSIHSAPRRKLSHKSTSRSHLNLLGHGRISKRFPLASLMLETVSLFLEHSAHWTMSTLSRLTQRSHATWMWYLKTIFSYVSTDKADALLSVASSAALFSSK